MDTLKRRVDEDTKTALRAGDKRRVGILRLILAAIKQREVDERVSLDDAGILQVLGKMVNQRKESLAIYTQAQPRGPGRTGSLRARDRAELPARTPRCGADRGPRGGGHPGGRAP
jgi:hypothetical protein